MIQNLIFLFFSSLLIAVISLFTFHLIPVSWLCDYNTTFASSKMNKQKYFAFAFLLFVLLLFPLRIIIYEDIPFLYKGIYLLLIVLFIHISISDILYQIIPDQHVLAICLLALPIVFKNGIPFHLIGLLIGVIPYFLVILLGVLFRRGEVLGMGDVKLMGALGFLFGGLKILPIYVLSGLTSGIFSFFMLLSAKILKKNEFPYIPLAPFICLSTLFYIFF